MVTGAESQRAGIGALFDATIERHAAERFRRETERMYAAREVVEQAAKNRRDAARELRDLGWTYQQIADVIPGGHAQNIHRLIQGSRKKEA